MKKLVSAVLAILLLSIATFAPLTLGVGETLGVHVGDWFRYKGTLVSWVASSPSIPFPPGSYDQDASDYNTTNYYVYTITKIDQNSSGNFVTYTIEANCKNGTINTRTTEEDLYNSPSDFFVMPVNLTVNTTVKSSYDWSDLFGGFFTWIWPPRIVNSTTTMTIGGSNREVDVCDFTQPPIFGTATPTRQVYTWDKALGVQVRYEVIVTDQTAYDASFNSLGTYSYDARLDLIDSSLPALAGGVIPEFPSAAVLLSLMAVFAAAIIVFQRKNR